MNVDDVRQDPLSVVVDPVQVDTHLADNGDNGDRGIAASNGEDCDSPQPLPPPSSPHTRGNATFGEELAPDTANNEKDPPRKKRWNNTSQARHWCLMFNNCTPKDLIKFEQAFET